MKESDEQTVPKLPSARVVAAATSLPWEGRRLDGRFRIRRKLAEGGCGVVYVAEDEQFGTEVAVKVLRAQATGEDEQRFRAEAKVLARLRDPRILRPLSWGVTPDERLYLVTELLIGVPFDEELRRCGRIPARRLLQLMVDVTRGLTEAHAAGVVHRDLKPGNLFIEQLRAGDETCRILDFGVAKVAGNSSVLTAGPAVRTDPEVMLGTVVYMSPEQVEGRPVDPRSDLYALGVVLFIALTGRRPFDGDRMEILDQHLHRTPPALAEVAPDLPIHPRLEALVQRLLAKRPDDRPATALQLRDELQALLALPDLESPAARSSSPRVPWSWVAAGAVAAAAATAWAWVRAGGG
jgi:serine/threonine-protein kinase